MPNSLPILLYHRIDDSGTSVATTRAEFRRHLQWLHDGGWRALNNEELGFYLRTRRALPARSFVITFDDGYHSLATSAFPILQEFRYSAVCFISTAFMRGARNPAHAPEADQHGELFLNWEQIRALQSCGVIDFQSHGHTHRRFELCEPHDVQADLALSREVLRDELGLPIHHFSQLAWPWGHSSEAGREVARRLGFRYQFTVARQSFTRDTPLDMIPRTCFDAAAFASFQRQFRLQSGTLGRFWNVLYPFGRRLRRLSGL